MAMAKFWELHLNAMRNSFHRHRLQALQHGDLPLRRLCQQSADLRDGSWLASLPLVRRREAAAARLVVELFVTRTKQPECERVRDQIVRLLLTTGYE
jgi:hypothetical protein